VEFTKVEDNLQFHDNIQALILFSTSLFIIQAVYCRKKSITNYGHLVEMAIGALR
jgi:hypothetical protein